MMIQIAETWLDLKEPDLLLLNKYWKASGSPYLLLFFKRGVLFTHYHWVLIVDSKEIGKIPFHFILHRICETGIYSEEKPRY